MKRSHPKTAYEPEMNLVVRRYVAPQAAILEQFARKVCVDMVQLGYSEFAAKEVSWNLGNFLKLVAELTTNQLNRRAKRLKRIKELS